MSATISGGSLIGRHVVIGVSFRSAGHRVHSLISQPRDTGLKRPPGAFTEWFGRVEGQSELERLARVRLLAVTNVERRDVELRVVPPRDGLGVSLEQQHGQRAGGLVKPAFA